MAGDDRRGTTISAKDLPLIDQMVKDYVGGRLGPGPDKLRRRRPAGGGGGGSKQYAFIVRSLQRPDPTTEPPTVAQTCYKIKRASEADYDAWAATHGLYEAGDKVVWTDGLDYECLASHTSAEGKDPDNASYWTLISLDAYILGYPYTDLIGTVPWLKVSAEVEVVQRDFIWYIHATVSRCEEVDDDGELSTSMQQNADPNDWRGMSVYK